MIGHARHLHRRLVRVGQVLALAVLPLVGLHGALAADVSSITAGYFESPPFVMDEGGQPAGLAIELWQDVAARHHWTTDYRRYATLGELVNAVARGEVDIAITDLTVSHERAQRIGFTQPWLDGGTRLLVGAVPKHGIQQIWDGLGNAGFLRIYGLIGVLIIVAAFLFTAFDRRFDPDFPKRWRDGLAESFYTVMKVVTSGTPPERKNLFGWIGRIWQGVWLVAGVAVLAFVTSTVTSVMTTLSLKHQISGISDLGDRFVGVLAGSVQESDARALNLNARAYPDLQRAAQALLDGEVQAVMADGPELEYYVHTHGDAPVRVVGRATQRSRYAFALPLGSELAQPVTLGILDAVESGRLERMKARYLASSP